MYRVTIEVDPSRYRHVNQAEVVEQTMQAIVRLMGPVYSPTMAVLYGDGITVRVNAAGAGAAVADALAERMAKWDGVRVERYTLGPPVMPPAPATTAAKPCDNYRASEQWVKTTWPGNGHARLCANCGHPATSHLFTVPHRAGVADAEPPEVPVDIHGIPMDRPNFNLPPYGRGQLGWRSPREG